jgi:FkbM family methyltransferase
VDFGSNMGLSVAGFLTHGAANSFVYAFEPVPLNCDRLRKTLRGYENRYRLSQCAVATYTGQVTFDLDDFGRFGGIGVGFDKKMEVGCRKASEIIDEILAERATIDVLKIDIEGLEMAVLCDLTPRQRSRIHKIFAELPVSDNPIKDTHSMAEHGTVRQFSLKRS